MVPASTHDAAPKRYRPYFSTFFLLPLLGFVLLVPQPVPAQSYVVVDLGTPGDSGSYSAAHGINPNGDVVGEWEATNSLWQQAFFYRNGTNSEIGPGGALIAYGINAHDQIVGQSGVAFIYAFIYSNGFVTDLGTIAGSYSVARAINSAADVVGESTIAATPEAPVHGVWYHGTLKTDLGTLPNGDYSSAYGINDAGDIVGESSTIVNGVTNIYAFLYTNGVMSDLGALGGDYSGARAINGSGQIVGEAAVPGGDVHAFLRTNGVMTDLGTFGGVYSTAAAINGPGDVVGYSLAADGEARAFLFTGSALLDLNDLIAPSSICTNLISADGINDVGQITGSGYTAAGEYHAFLLTPRFHLTRPRMSDTNQFSATAVGVPGQRFVFEASANLVDWIALATNTLVTNVFTCTDAPGPGYEHRFYRAVLLP